MRSSLVFERILRHSRLSKKPWKCFESSALWRRGRTSLLGSWFAICKSTLSVLSHCGICRGSTSRASRFASHVAPGRKLEFACAFLRVYVLLCLYSLADHFFGRRSRIFDVHQNLHLLGRPMQGSHSSMTVHRPGCPQFTSIHARHSRTPQDV